MQSAYLWVSLGVVVVLLLLVILLAVLLRRRGAQRRPQVAAEQPPPPTTAPDPVSWEAAAAHRPAAPRDEMFTPARPAPVLPAEPAAGDQFRSGIRAWPAIGVRELAAASRQASLPVLRGIVRGDDGAALSDAVLTVINVTGGQAGNARTDARGRYQLSIPEEGQYVLIARGVNHDPYASTVSVTGQVTDCDVRLTSAAKLSGLVTDAEGTAVANATVILTNTTGVVVSAQRSNVQGGYTVTGLTPGLYTMTTAAEGFDPVASLVDVPPTGMVRQNVEFTPRRLTLRGITAHVTDGAPLAGIRVRLLDATGLPLAETRTVAGGRYEFTGLEPGRYTVAASGYPEVLSPVRLEGGNNDEHDVRLGYSDEQHARLGHADEQHAPLGYPDEQHARLGHADEQHARLGHAGAPPAPLDQADIQESRYAILDEPGARLGHAEPIAPTSEPASLQNNATSGKEHGR